MNLARIVAAVCGISFIFFGILCWNSLPVVSDFQRFGLERVRVLTGILEILGGVGLLVGLRWRPALVLSSGGLAIMMLVAFAVRLRVRDSVAQSLPSFLFMLANVYLLVETIRESRRVF